MVWYAPPENPHDDPVTHWQSLVDRRLIGRIAATPAGIARNRARFEAYFLAPHRRPALPSGLGMDGRPERDA